MAKFEETVLVIWFGENISKLIFCKNALDLDVA
jgi:hypothetical protein